MTRFKEALKESVEEIKELKLEGLPNIFRARHIVVSFFWLCLFVACGIVCIILVKATVDEYTKYHVTTTVRYLSEQQSVFPTVSFCNLNPFTTQYAVDLLSQAGIPTPMENQTVDYWSWYLTVNDYMFKTHGRYLSDSERALLTDFNQTFIDCSFDDGKPCEFDHIFHPDYFNCYRFNPKGDRVAYRTSIDFQLKVVLYAGQAPELKVANLKGFYIMMQNKSDYPVGPDRTAFFVTTGLAANFAPERSFYNQYQWPYSECAVIEENKIVYSLGDMSLYNKLAHDEQYREYTYTQLTCYSLCTQEMLNTECGCNSNRIGYQSEGYEPCSYSKENECVADFYARNTTSEEINKECAPRCPIECSRTVLDTTISYYTYPAAYLNRYKLKLNSTGLSQTDYDAYVLNNLVEINVFYDSLSYVETLEDPKMSAEDFLGSLGGHLHLFLGMSLLTFIEIVELVIIVLLHSVTDGFSISSYKKPASGGHDNHAHSKDKEASKQENGGDPVSNVEEGNNAIDYTPNASNNGIAHSPVPNGITHSQVPNGTPLATHEPQPHLANNSPETTETAANNLSHVKETD